MEMQAVKMFKDYVNAFDINDPMVNRKYYHTFRVTNFAEEIAESLNLRDEEKQTVFLGALFHDIARFRQAKEYEDYSGEENTFDHGDVGALILDEFENVLKDKIDIIKVIVKEHNKFSLPDIADERILKYIMIVKDADKLDIISNYSERDLSNSKDEKFSKKCLAEFYKRKLIKTEDLKTNSDAHLRSNAFVFDFSFKKSLEIYKKLGLNERMNNNFLKYNKKEEKEIKKIKEFVNSYIEERLGE